MEFRCVIYREQEILTDKSLPEDIRNLFGKLRRRGMDVFSVGEKKISQALMEAGYCGEEALFIGATDASLREAKEEKVASIGFPNSSFLSEKLYDADILVESFEEVDFYFLERIYQRKHNIPWIVIEMKRCYLREMTVEDLPDLYEMYDGEGMTKYMEPLSSWEKEKAFTEAYIKNMYRYYGYGMWLVKDRNTDELIGRAGLNNLEFEGENMLEMGYAIARPYQKKGYATEACEGVIAYAKGAQLGYEKLYCFVWEGNKASEAVLKRLGFDFQKKVQRDGKKMLLFAISLA